ncbi:MAG TPA: hypothetical protein VGQ59_00660 [Cyclobacteriaceae bacterium]|jgi:hypothetical protein|nr:hypothetical protein [Cyclobacteriaceae bacterium]
MEEKISSKAIDVYSNNFASKLADSFFQKKDKINGQEILALSEIKQVNLLVVKELMRLWNAEQQKWQSPFFDYGADAVQKSKEQFKNTLSNNILISKKDFLPLLKLAVSQTLFLVLAPYDFFSNVLDSRGNGVIKVSDLKNETRYLKINKAPLEKLVEKLEERKSDAITGNEAFALLDHILEEVNFTPEDIDGHIAAFSKLIPITIERLLEQEETTREVKRSPSLKEPISAPAVEETKRKEFRIKDSLTINQKFMFTKILFSGDFEVFSEAIARFDKFRNLNEALSYIDENYSQWDKESEEFEEFLSILQRKFS